MAESSPDTSQKNAVSLEKWSLGGGHDAKLFENLNVRVGTSISRDGCSGDDLDGKSEDGMYSFDYFSSSRHAHFPSIRSLEASSSRAEDHRETADTSNQARSKEVTRQFPFQELKKFNTIWSVPLCIMFWSVKYAFTCKRWHFLSCQHRYLFSTENQLTFGMGQYKNDLNAKIPNFRPSFPLCHR